MTACTDFFGFLFLLARYFYNKSEKSCAAPPHQRVPVHWGLHVLQQGGGNLILDREEEEEQQEVEVGLGAMGLVPRAAVPVQPCCILRCCRSSSDGVWGPASPSAPMAQGGYHHMLPDGLSWHPWHPPSPLPRSQVGVHSPLMLRTWSGAWRMLSTALALLASAFYWLGGGEGAWV